MDVRLVLTNVGPHGYEVHFSRLDSAQVSPDTERHRLGPDQLTKSRYMTGVTKNKRQMWFETWGRLSPDIGERWRMEQGNLVAELAREEFPDGLTCCDQDLPADGCSRKSKVVQ